jgi:adenylosuccinate lyase
LLAGLRAEEQREQMAGELLRLNALFESLHESVTITDANGRVLSMNPAARLLWGVLGPLGVPPDAMLGDGQRSLDDSANRRLVIPDSFLDADAVLGLAAHISAGLVVREGTIAARVARELPFMATETLLMEAALRGGDRQLLHERIRGYSFDAQSTLETKGGENPLIDLIVSDADFRLTRQEVEPWLDPVVFTGRSAAQVDEFLDEVVAPALEGTEAATIAAPRV